MNRRRRGLLLGGVAAAALVVAAGCAPNMVRSAVPGPGGSVQITLFQFQTAAPSAELPLRTPLTTSPAEVHVPVVGTTPAEQVAAPAPLSGQALEQDRTRALQTEKVGHFCHMGG